ncbi:hypothetical protein GF314_10820 [bacterium]|nr:hypothetical protein [bacterium]
MRQTLQELLELHDALVQALDVGDVDAFGRLLERRGEAIEALAHRLEAATAAERRAVTDQLVDLQRLDRELQARSREARDDLGHRLAAGQPQHAPASSMSGVLDRRA